MRDLARHFTAAGEALPDQSCPWLIYFGGDRF